MSRATSAQYARREGDVTPPRWGLFLQEILAAGRGSVAIFGGTDDMARRQLSREANARPFGSVEVALLRRIYKHDPAKFRGG